MNFWRRGVGVVALVVLSACSTLPQHEAGIDGVACVGMVGTMPAGLAAASNDELMKQARLATDKGGVCTARVWVVQQPVKVYRVYDSSRSYSQFGRWWALSKPTGSRDVYRAEYGICPTWSGLDHLVSCTLKPNTQIVVGTTQSVDCGDAAHTVYPKTANLQVYVPNAPNDVRVENCQDEGAWPAQQ